MRTSRVPIIVSLTFLIFFLLPIYYLYYGAYTFGKGSFDVSIIESEVGPLVNSIVTGLGGAVLGTALGAVYAWFLVRTDIPGKRLLGTVPLLALTMPLLTKALGWIFLLNPSNGILNALVMYIFHLSSAPFNIYGAGGIIFASGVGGMPLAYLIMRPALATFDPSLEEASRVAGSSIFRTMLRVTLPGILPAFASVFLLLFINGLRALDYALILGTPVNYDTLATEVNFWGNYNANYGYAATIGVEYVAITIVLVTIYIWVTRKSFRFAVLGGKSPRRTLNGLGRWRFAGLLVCFVIFVLVFLVPFSTLVFVSFAKSFTFINGRLISSFWLGNWTSALSLPLLWQSFITSLEFAFAAGMLSTVIGLFLSYSFLKSRVKRARAFEYVSYLPLVIPGIVYSLALFWTFLFLPGVSNVLYGTVWPMVISVTFIFLPASVRMISANMVQISDELEESPRVLGLGWWGTFRVVVVPLIGGSLVTSFFYVFVDSIRELGAVILLTTSSTVVLDVLLLQIWSNQTGSLGVVSAASTLVTLFIGVVLLISELFRRYRLSRGSGTDLVGWSTF